MNRKDLQNLSNIRLREALALFRARQFSGAYYLAGYAVECALKACIAKQFRRYEFPDKRIVNNSWTHDLSSLVKVANLNELRRQRTDADEIFQKNWNLITLWSEDSRYRTTDKATCRELLNAIMEENHGVIPWIRERW